MANPGQDDLDELDLGQTIRGFAPRQKLFRRFTLQKILGRGGMGVVWLAHDDELDRQVALKFLPDLVVHDRALLDDLKRETKRNLDLTHYNIVRIYDLVQDETAACISMEYVDGDTLSALRVDRPGRIFQAPELTEWIIGLCEGLDYAHRRAKIVHRDLKPANLMVNSQNDIKITDFGIARNISDNISMMTRTQGTAGTLVYMSPQQWAGDRPTALDDIYAVGATIYELLTSKPPFYTGNIDRQIEKKIPPSMKERREELNITAEPIPPVWEEIVAACLAKDAAHRPQSTREIAARLCADGGTGATLPAVFLRAASGSSPAAAGPPTSPPVTGQIPPPAITPPAVEPAGLRTDVQLPPTTPPQRAPIEPVAPPSPTPAARVETPEMPVKTPTLDRIVTPPIEPALPEVVEAKAPLSESVVPPVSREAPVADEEVDRKTDVLPPRETPPAAAPAAPPVAAAVVPPPRVEVAPAPKPPPPPAPKVVASPPLPAAYVAPAPPPAAPPPATAMPAFPPTPERFVAPTFVPAEKKSSPLVLVGGVVGLLVIAAAAAYFFLRPGGSPDVPPPAPTPTKEIVDVKPSPSPAASARPTEAPTSAPTPTTPREFAFSGGIRPAGATIELNGKRLIPNTVGNKLVVPLPGAGGAPAELSVKAPGYKPYYVRAEPGRAVDAPVVLERQTGKVGFIFGKSVADYPSLGFAMTRALPGEATFVEVDSTERVREARDAVSGALLDLPTGVYRVSLLGAGGRADPRIQPRVLKEDLEIKPGAETKLTLPPSYAGRYRYDFTVGNVAVSRTLVLDPGLESGRVDDSYQPTVPGAPKPADAKGLKLGDIRLDSAGVLSGWIRFSTYEVEKDRAYDEHFQIRATPNGTLLISGGREAAPDDPMVRAEIERIVKGAKPNANDRPGSVVLKRLD